MFLSKQLTTVEFEKDIELNIEKSSGSYLFDDLSQSTYLDLFSYFASNTLGYSHPGYDTDSFKHDILKYAPIKISSGRIYLKYFDEFLQEFHTFCSAGIFSRYFFIHGGALAVENALKVAFDYKRRKYETNSNNLKVISFRKSFHGVSGYTLALSDLPPAKVRDFPMFNWKKVHSPTVRVDNTQTIASEEARADQEIRDYIKEVGSQNVAALVVEPIQCSGGDYTYRREFFMRIRLLCSEFDIPLVFDEIQTGFGVTGKLWYWQHLGIEPDILVFGKKAQVCGIAVTPAYADGAMTIPHRLNVTWDGHILDIVRARHLMKILKSERLIESASSKGKMLREGLLKNGSLKDVRGVGLLAAFDLPSQSDRDKFFRAAFEEKLLVNIAADQTIRLRPNLAITIEEIAVFHSKVEKVLKRIGLS